MLSLLRAVGVAAVLAGASAARSHHGEELASFVRAYASGAPRADAAKAAGVDADALRAAADAHRKRIRAHYGLGDDFAQTIDAMVFEAAGRRPEP